MKTLNLRQAIIQRVQNKSNEELLEVIAGSIDNDEKALPGLGVLFEIIWKNLDEKQQLDLASVLHRALLLESRV
jgi:small acid-soluble spore protein I (minor)